MSFLVSLSVALAGWFGFNAVMFSTDKDAFDDKNETFPLRIYFNKVWDNWLGSLVFLPALVCIGYFKLDMRVAVGELGWSDGYYVLSGFVFEFVKTLWKGWKERQKK